MFRRRGLAKTRKELHQLLGEEDRERVMDWWNLAEECFKTERGDPSWLTGYLLMVMAVGVVETSGSEVPPTAYIATARVGYSLRMFFYRFAFPMPLDVTTIDRNAIATLASRPRDPESGMLSVDAVSDADDELLTPVVELVSQIVNEPVLFNEMVSGEGAFWNACVSIAVYQLQKNAQQAGLVRHGRQLDLDSAEIFLRYGFVLRALDEALGLVTGDRGAAQGYDERCDDDTSARRPQDLPPHLKNR